MTEFSNIFSSFSLVSLSNLLYTMAGIIMILSFLAKDILWLRTIFMIALLFNAVSGALLGLYSVIIWDLLFCVIHLYQIIKIILERSAFLVPKKLKSIYTNIFSAMTPKEFIRFWEKGRKITGKNIKLCKEGDDPKDLLFIYDGEVKVAKKNKELASVKKGSFIGEMSFLTGEKISADVIGKGAIECMAWSQAEIKKLKKLNPAIFAKIVSILGVDLVHKLRKQNKHSVE